MPAKDKLPISAPLAAAIRLTKRLGREFKDIEITTQDGNKIPAILVSHGNSNVVVKAEKNMVSVTTLIEIPDDVSKKLATAPPEARLRALVSLKQQLFSHARTGANVVPFDAKDISEVKRIFIEQYVFLPQNEDVYALNRYLDAIQEVITVRVRASSIFGIIGEAISSTGQTTPSDAPPGMYS